MLTLDGSTLEGGGQLVRVALSISSICGIPLRITNIRANRAPRQHAHASKSKQSRNDRRPEGGLKESHLAALAWLADQCNADVQGNEVGSRDVIFRPAKRKANNPRANGGEIEHPEVIELQKPGSVWLIWQAILPYIVFKLLDTQPPNGTNKNDHPTSPESPHAQPETSSATNDAEIAFRVILKGGTNVPKSPSSEYMQQVFLPLCEKIGLPKIDIHVKKRGWAGSAPDIGEVEIIVYNPKSQSTADTLQEGYRLPPFHLRSPGLITHISMTILAGSSQTHTLVETTLKTALRARPLFSSPALPITLHPSSSMSSGDERRLYILLVAHTADGYRLGRDCLGSGRKMSSETDRRQIVDQVVTHVVHNFTRECEAGGCVDEFAEDQLVVFQALAAGKTSVETGRQTRRTQEMWSLHTRTVRWVCNEMLGTVFDGHGGCEGLGMVDDGDVESVSRGLAAVDIDEGAEDEDR